MDSTAITTIVVAVFASTGFWTFLTAVFQSKSERKSAESHMLMGLGHEKIMELGMKYISRGFITKDEYEDLDHYLFKPYELMGGNGSAKRIMEEVNKLPIK